MRPTSDEAASTPSRVGLVCRFDPCGDRYYSAALLPWQSFVPGDRVAPFTIGSFAGTVTSPLLPSPVVTPYSAGYFALAFGAATIPPQGSLQGPLCVGGHFDEATLTWTFVDAGGASFTTPVIQFLGSPI